MQWNSTKPGKKEIHIVGKTSYWELSVEKFWSPYRSKRFMSFNLEWRDIIDHIINSGKNLKKCFGALPFTKVKNMRLLNQIDLQATEMPNETYPLIFKWWQQNPVNNLIYPMFSIKSKSVRHTKKQDDMTHRQEKRQIIGKKDDKITNKIIWSQLLKMCLVINGQ